MAQITPALTIVIPAYQEEKRIGPTLQELGNYLAGRATNDVAAISKDPPSAKRSREDRQNPGGAVENQWPVSRAFFSAALRAAYRTISGGRETSPSARATASSSIRGTLRSRKIGSPCRS